MTKKKKQQIIITFDREILSDYAEKLEDALAALLTQCKIKVNILDTITGNEIFIPENAATDEDFRNKHHME